MCIENKAVKEICLDDIVCTPLLLLSTQHQRITEYICELTSSIPDAGKDWRQKDSGAAADEIVR